jgi:hypothetical protein
MAAMAHLMHKAHVDKETLGRVNDALMLVLIGSGVAACAIGAVVYDAGKLISVW